MAIFNSYVCLPEGTWILFGYGSTVLKISWWFIRLSHYLGEAFNHPKLVQDFAGLSTVCSGHPIWHVSDPTGPTAWHDITRTRPCNMICFIGVISEVETLITTSVYTSTCHLHPSNIASLQPRGFSKLNMFPLCFPHMFTILKGTGPNILQPCSHDSALDARCCTTASPSCGNQQSMAAAVGLLAMCTVQMLVRFGSFVSHVDEYTNWQWAFQRGVQR